MSEKDIISRGYTGSHGHDHGHHGDCGCGGGEDRIPPYNCDWDDDRYYDCDEGEIINPPIHPPVEPPICPPPIDPPVEPPVRPPVDADCGGPVLAMGYVPKQRWVEVYDAKKGLAKGSIFPSLVKPWTGKGHK